MLVSFIGAGLAGFGAVRASAYLLSPSEQLDQWTPAVGLLVFFAVLALMFKGVDAIKREDDRKEIDEQMRKLQKADRI